MIALTGAPSPSVCGLSSLEASNEVLTVEGLHNWTRRLGTATFFVSLCQSESLPAAALLP